MFGTRAMSRVPRFLFVILVLILDSPGLHAGPELERVDVSGEKGRDGQDGTDYSGSTASGSGSDGRDGGDGTPGKRGQDAGDIAGALRSSGPKPGAFVLAGTMRPPGTELGRDFQLELQLDSPGYLYLLAEGGQGGRGGNAGGGQDGARGSRGSNATRYTPAGSGGRGGDGGDAGDPADGGPGAKGGKIRIALAEADMHLLMAVKYCVDGGGGGKAGQFAKPGKGGAGGSGGSGCSWQTTEYYTDSQGKRQSRTKSHSRPSGSSGSSGSDGQPSRESVSAGKEGEDGLIEFVVDHVQGGPVVYNSRYDIEVAPDYELISHDQNGVIEFGEKVRVRGLRIRNKGGMPTPTHQLLGLSLINQGWVLDSTSLYLEKSLKPGEEYTFTDEVEFRVRDTEITQPGNRFEVTETIRPRSWIETTLRDFDEPEGTQGFRITFPIEITPISMLHTLSPGQVSRFFWEIRNISNKDFGGATEIARQIQNALKLREGTLNAEQIVFKDSSGGEFRLNEGFIHAIANLKAGETIRIEGEYGVRRGSLANTHSTVRLTLGLGKIGEGNVLRDAQLRDFTVKVGQVYEQVRDADILLVINHSTTREEVEKWKEQRAQLGEKIAIWDLSYYGFFELTKTLDETGSRLVDDLKGKTIIMLDNPYDSESGPVHVHDYLARKEFLEAAGEAGINFLFIGDANPDGHNILIDYLMPAEEGSRVGQKFDGIKALLANYRKAHRDKEHSKPDDLLPDDFSKSFHSVDIKHWSMFGIPSNPEKLKKRNARREKRLKREAQALQDRLTEQYPTEQYLVVYDFQPELVNQHFGWNTWRYGSLEVRRLVNSNLGVGATLEIHPDDVHKPAFIESEELEFAVSLTKNFQQNLKSLQTLVTKRSKELDSEEFERVKKALTQAIWVKLAQEQYDVRDRFFNGFTWQREIRERLPRLKRLTESELPFVDPESESGKLLIHLIAGIEYMVKEELSFWNWVIIGTRDTRATEVSMKLLDAWKEELFTPKYGDMGAAKGHLKKAKQMIELEVERMFQEDKTSKQEARKAARAAKRKAEPVATGIESLLSPLEAENLTADIEVRSEDGNPVLSKAELEKLLAVAKARRERRAILVRNAAQAKADLLLKKVCEARLVQASR